MQADQQALYERLVRFEIDEPGVELTFARRLAKEQGWSLPYAERVIGEYKRFLLLAMHAGHVATPSEQVDQAWHLHLTYTRSYWEKLCRGVLGRPLHHGPTQGGEEELAKYKDLYARTLASYQRLFGETPPGDIWSDVETRFRKDSQHVVVNTARNWVIPKPRWPQRSAPPAAIATPVLALAAFGAPLVVGSLNPFDMRGPMFLALYLLLCAIALVGALFVRATLLASEDVARASDFSGAAKGKPLDAYEVACLASGANRTIDAAVASMMHAGTLKFVEEKRKGFWGKTVIKLGRGEPLPASAPDLERVIYETAAPPVENVLAFRRPAKPAADAIEEHLAERGLVRPSATGLSRAQWAGGLIMASPLLIGVPKLIIGQMRDKPTGFLTILCVLTGVAAIVVLVWRRYRTAEGDRALAQYNDQFIGMRNRQAADLSPSDMGMLVALFGASMLVGGPLAPLQPMMSHAAGGSGCGTSGCGSGCGGGGCGGGGCGGCGGD